MTEPTQSDWLARENDSLRQENARLRAALEGIRPEEPEEIIRAISHGEVEALVVQEEGQEKLYSLQSFDSIYLSVIEECFPYGVWMAEPDGKLLYASPSFLKLLQTTLQKMQERGQFHFLPPETRARVEREWMRCQKEHKTFDVEYTARFGDGSERTIWTHGILARTYGGLPRWAGVNIDVTERRKIEDELQQKAETLREKKAELERANETLREEMALHQQAEEALQEAGRRKDEFLALLGHELRNPLAAIQNGLHILLLPDLGQSTVKQVKEMMEKQAHHLTRLVDDLLDVSRITRGKIQLQKERVELTAAVRHAIASMRPLIEAQHHRLTVSLPTEGIYLEADPTRLEQVLVNLLHNAAKYTSPGGEITLRAEREGDEAVIRVRDTGIGIPKDLLPKVFDMFIQANQSLDRAKGGLGIGLTLVRDLVEMHSGSVTAHSEGPGKGSEFVLRLRALPVVADEPKAVQSEAATANRRMRVLVVDDSEDLAESLKILLEFAGHDVQVVYDGPAALTAYRSYQPDVVLLDIGLPGMNGYEVARQLRREQGTRIPFLVAVSGYGQQEDKRRCHEAGFDFHMTKPVNPNALASLVASAPSLVEA